MKLSTREDIEAPIASVFSAVADFDSHERRAMRRGADVMRLEDPGEAGPKWMVQFVARGRTRQLELETVQFDAPHALGFRSASAGLNGLLSVELLALARTRTRLIVGLDLKPTNLSSRLLIQSLKFAKHNLTRRFSRRVGEFAKEIERQTAGPDRL